MIRLLPLLLLACSATHRDAVQLARARTGLAAQADAYWFAVRWNDPEAAGAFLDSADARLGLLRLVQEHTIRLSDAQVVQVEVGPLLPATAAPHLREGVAHVRVEAYEAAGTRLRSEVVEQHWVLTDGNHWLVDTARSPVTADRLW